MTSIEAQIAGLTKNTVDNLADIIVLFNRGFFYYLQKCDYVYECKFNSFDANINKKNI